MRGGKEISLRREEERVDERGEEISMRSKKERVDER